MRSYICVDKENVSLKFKKVFFSLKINTSSMSKHLTCMGDEGGAIVLLLKRVKIMVARYSGEHGIGGGV